MTRDSTRPKLAMRVSAIRFGADLWRLLESEAALVGVSVSQYVREAALMRASAAITARGQEPVELMAQTAARGAVENKAERARATARGTRADARALKAEAEQAAKHARQLQR